MNKTFVKIATTLLLNVLVVTSVVDKSYASLDNLTFKYTITNKSKQYDLIIKPLVDEFIETNNLIHSTYYSLDGGETKKSVEDFITIHKADKNDSGTYKYDEVIVEMNFSAANNASITAENTCALEFYSSKSKPGGYRDHYKYTLDTVDGNKIAYKQEYCETCGKLIGEPTAMLSSTYVIATPDNAQDVLDGDIDGKVVIFDEGYYNNELILRASKYSNTQIKIGGVWTDATQDVINSLANTHYYYSRNIEDVTFTAVEGAYFTNKFRELFSISAC